MKSHLFDSKEFEKIRQELSDFEEKRESIIQLSREVISLSKRVIYAVHRDDIPAAEKELAAMEKKKKELQKNNLQLDITINKTAFQEYAEALTFYHFVKSKKLATSRQLGIDTESYLLGLCDLTGELGRRAVNSVIKQNYKEADLIRQLVDEIYGQFLQFNLRNSELRTKSDQIKWNLKKLEDVVYELKLKGKL